MAQQAFWHCLQTLEDSPPLAYVAQNSKVILLVLLAPYSTKWATEAGVYWLILNSEPRFAMIYIDKHNNYKPNNNNNVPYYAKAVPSKKSHTGNLQGIRKEKKGPEKRCELHRRPAIELQGEGEPQHYQCDAWATCFSASQKSFTLKAVQGDYRSPNPSTLAAKRVSFELRIS